MGWPGAMSTIRCTRLVVEIGLSLYISREKGGHYYLQTLHNDIFSQYNLIMSPPRASYNTPQIRLIQYGRRIGKKFF